MPFIDICQRTNRLSFLVVVTQIFTFFIIIFVSQHLPITATFPSIHFHSPSQVQMSLSWWRGLHTEAVPRSHMVTHSSPSVMTLVEQSAHRAPLRIDMLLGFSLSFFEAVSRQIVSMNI